MVPASVWTYFRYQVNFSSALERLHNFSWHFEYTLINGEILKFLLVFHTFTGYMFVKTCSHPLYLYTNLSYNFILIVSKSINNCSLTEPLNNTGL